MRGDQRHDGHIESSSVRSHPEYSITYGITTLYKYSAPILPAHNISLHPP